MINKLEKFLELGGTKKDITLLVLSGISLIISIFDVIPGLPVDAAWIAIILCGIPIILEAVIGLVTEFDIKADVLVSLALIAAIIIHEDFAAGEVAFIMQLGGLLEDLTVEKARAGIEKLVQLTPRTARVITLNGGRETENVIPAEAVKVDDILRVLPGETIPVDGVIVSGQTSINQAAMTGESIPVDKTVGDEVSSGTVNQFGAFDMRAAKVGEDSSIQRMIRLVQSADSGKAKIVGLADRWATWVVVIALAASVLTYLATHEILRSVTILVVFCPCAMVLATPTAIMAAIGNAARHGFLVREGDALERLASVRKLAFDKTGTLTAGVPEVAAVECLTSEFSKEDIFRLTACSEMKSEHPLAKAIVAGYKKLHGDEKLLSAPEIFKMLPGQGVSAVMEGHRILAGNVKLMNENHIPVDSAVQKAMVYQKQGCTAIFIAIDEKPAGILALSDTLKTGAASVMDAVRETGVIPVLLTGDNEYAAKTIADKLNIKDVRWNCMPEDKLDYIKKSQQDHKENICMAGDGINDAPALKMAHVGIAMGGIGSDIAIDAADITLINDDIKELPHLLGLSKRMMTVIKLNLTFSMSLNFIAIILAISGVLNPVAGALVHNCGSVVVIINSAFLLKWKHKK